MDKSKSPTKVPPTSNLCARIESSGNIYINGSVNHSTIIVGMPQNEVETLLHLLEMEMEENKHLWDLVSALINKTID